MKINEKNTFAKLLETSLEVYGFKLSRDATALWWACLERFEFGDIKRALAEHIQDAGRGRFAPKPADVIGALQARDGWIGVEEAWAIVAPTLTNEAITVFWTSPMRNAFGVALQLADDPIGARLAFKEVYPQEVARARRCGEKPVWSMSPGTDPHGRERAINEAARLGRLTQGQASTLLLAFGFTPFGLPAVSLLIQEE